MLNFYNNAYLSSILLILLFLNPIFSQVPCGTTEIHDNRYVIDANYRHDFDVRMQHRKTILETTLSQDRFICNEPIIVPVAVHYNGVTTQTLDCLTDLALFQIDQLNKEFSATNDEISNFYEDIIGTDIDPESLAEEGTCIQFCLADVNHPPLSGISEGEYAITVNESFVANGSYLFTHPMWAGYLNIVVPNDLFEYLGYTQLLQPADGSTIVVSSCVWGRGGAECGDGFGSGQTPFGECTYIPPSHTYNKTTSHEVGHFLGLNHVWESEEGSGCDYDDGFTDTPNASGPTYGCPNNNNSCWSDDMQMNYMDYSDDECRYMFSEQQATFMYNRASELWGVFSSKCSSNLTVNDASVRNIIFPLNTSCTSDVAPVVLLENVGTTNLTSVEFSYSVDGGESGTYVWTGNLSMNETEIVYLPMIAGLSGNYTLNIETSNPNGLLDDNPFNDAKDKSVSIVDGISLPFMEDNEDFLQPFPAQGALTTSIIGDAHDWIKKSGISGYNEGLYCIHFDNFNVEDKNKGNDDWFVLPDLNVTEFNSINLTFDLAYTYFQNESEIRDDELSIMYSLGCSGAWEEIWSKNGSDLATVPPMASIYEPESVGDWVTKEMGINTNGSDYIRIAFVNKTGKGNSLYLDNINIQGSTAIVSTNEIESLSQFDISPNPSQGYLNVNVEFEQNKQFEILIHDVMGRELYYRKQIAAISNEQLDLSTFSNGVYLISIRSGNQIVTEKIVLNK